MLRDMAYRPTEIGVLLFDDAAKAHGKLKAAFAKHRTRKAVADALGVKPATIARWVKWLIDNGHSDPRI